ncbi:MAG TPA: efflux RND transporter periplasmic adaptor subunit [Vicinamibacteria bacterium]|nr:efflux RND transporter periplasmic adaptor subunit [Vicinamibacteria bacterium]
MSAFSDRLQALRGRLGRAKGRRVSLLVLGGLVLMGLAARRDPGSLPEPIAVKRDDLVLAVEMEGELAAVHSSEIGAPAVNEWEFKIALMAPEGSEVKKGDPVLGFDTEKIQRLLDEKRAELKEAEGKLEQKALEVRMKTLELDQQIAGAEAEAGKSQLKAEVPEDLLGRVEAEKARLEHEGRSGDLKNLQAERSANLARADAERRTLLSQRDRARGRVAELEQSIERLTMRAPQDGLVLHKADWRDEKKKVGDQIWRGEVVLSIPDLKEMRADAMVDEADGGQVSVGQSVLLRLEARPDLDFHGRVRGIAQTVRKKSWRVPAKVFKVDVELEHTDAAIMRPAMRFRGEIETGRLKDRLLIPRTAVFLRESGPIVQVRRALGFTEVAVKLGRSNREFVEAVEGLREGDLVLPVDLAAGAPDANAARPTMGPAR